jgi:HemY protein
MLRILLFLLLLGLAALGLAWIVDRPGEIVLTWQGYHVETSVAVGLAILLIAAAAIAIVWGVLRFLYKSPRRMRQRAAAKRQAKGLAALSRGMIAVGAGDVRLARKSAAEAQRHLSDEPLAHLLNAQAAQLSGDRGAAVAAFETLAALPATRLLGLRGLHVEAQRRGDHEAALHYAHEAHKIAPLPWSAKAVLEHRAAHAQWEAALAALESHIAAKLVDKPTGARQKAVLETAIALDKADRAPDEALRLARQALAFAPDLIPATVLAARIMSRRGDVRKAAKLIEAAWARARHPELAEAYLDLRSGDSNADRLAKARALAKLAPQDPESAMIVARAGLAARDFVAARKAMAPLIAEGERPSLRACLIMAELEDAEFGDQGQVREWLARSARAPRDPAWIADGVVSKQWAPVSPVTGRLDAFVWQKPAERLAAESTDVEAADWVKHWALPKTSSNMSPKDLPPPPAAAVIEATPVPSVENRAAALDPVPVQALRPGETALAGASLPASLPSLRTRARAVQKVVFPLPAAPDDPGPEETVTEDQESPEIRRIGHL